LLTGLSAQAIFFIVAMAAGMFAAVSPEKYAGE
jgi:hypothetical protein